MSPLVIRARVMPRGLLDGVIALVVGGLLTVAVLLVPSLLAAALLRSSGTLMLTVLVLYALWLSFTVRHLRCGAEGLQFVRALGEPKLIPWSAIDSVEEASRGELIRRGWLWPLFPAREMTPSLTSVGHYRIRWSGKDAYFPPANPKEFLEAIQRGRERAAEQVDEADKGRPA